MGFSTQNIIGHKEGFIVEGDILIRNHELDALPDSKFLRVGGEEQYHTYNLVTGLPRTVTLKFKDGWPPAEFQAYREALDIVVARYNALGLRLTLQRSIVPGPANIFISRDLSISPFLGLAVFPTANGEPGNLIRINTVGVGNTYSRVLLLAHEIGHCIGFRHTDYADRSFSCGGAFAPESANPLGAVHIPGTPVGPDPNSWMLACLYPFQDRPFNSNDVIALNYVY